MIAFMFAIVMLGAGALYANAFPSAPAQKHLRRDKGSAANWLTYRNAVVSYAEHNPSQFTQSPHTVSMSALNLPPNYAALNTYYNRVGGGEAVVYAALPRGTLHYLMRDTSGDASIGVVTGGNINSPDYGNVGAAPSYVPSGDIVSVFTQ